MRMVLGAEDMYGTCISSRSNSTELLFAAEVPRPGQVVDEDLLTASTSLLRTLEDLQ